MRPALFLALLACGLATAQEQSLEDGSFEMEGCSRDDRCECQFSGNWSIYREYVQLRKIRSRVVQIQQVVSTLDVQLIMRQMRNVTSRITVLEQRVEHQSVSVTIRELSGIQKNVEILVALVEQLQASGETDVQVAALKREVEALLVVIDEMWSRNPYGESDAVKAELDALRQRLANCHDNVQWSAFEGDTLPVDYNYNDWCDTNELSSVGEAITHRWMPNPYGAWFKDPVPATESNRSEIFTRIYHTNLAVDKFRNYSNFIANKNVAKTPAILSHGVGFVLFNQSLFSSYSNRIYKRNLKLGTTQNRVVTKADINYLDNTLATFVDFKVDEYGLWAITATPANNNKLVIYKVNPNDLSFTESYVTNKHKTSVCALFMSCGKLYTIDVCTDRLKPDAHHKQYVYDTKTRKEVYVRMAMTSKFGHIWSLNYNPRERVLFGWDNQHLVTYPLTWAARTETAEIGQQQVAAQRPTELSQQQVAAQRPTGLGQQHLAPERPTGLGEQRVI